MDLIFPHHENEIAQSCANNNSKKLANYWIHNGFITYNKQKMSKSVGNITTIKEASKNIQDKLLGWLYLAPNTNNLWIGMMIFY